MQCTVVLVSLDTARLKVTNCAVDEPPISSVPASLEDGN
jgi:hypothetical protein